MSPINNFELRHVLEVTIVGDESQVVGQAYGGNLPIRQGDAEPIGIHGGSHDSSPLGGLGVKDEKADAVQEGLHRSGQFG